MLEQCWLDQVCYETIWNIWALAITAWVIWLTWKTRRRN